MEIIGGIVGLVLIWKLGRWFVTGAIESWRTKDEAFRRDCIGIPICAVILGVAVAILGLDALFHFIPYDYLNAISGHPELNGPAH